MIGLNSGLLGARRVPTTSSASGLWVPNEQSLAKRAAIWPISGSDPSWSSVSLLLKMEDTDGGTTFTDSSTNALTMTSTAVVTTTQYKFGTRSADFQSGSKVIETPASSLFNFPGDFTVEMWARWSTTAAAISYRTLFTLGTYTDGILFRDDEMYVNNNVVTSDIGLDDDNNWHHYAVARSGSSLKAFKDGTAFATATTSATVNSGSASMQLGRSRHATGTEYWIGQIDEVRVTKGVARYTADFTPPTEPFPDA